VCFAGNTAEVTTVEYFVETIESRYGKSASIWVMVRGIVSENNVDLLLGCGWQRPWSHEHPLLADSQTESAAFPIMPTVARHVNVPAGESSWIPRKTHNGVFP